VDKYIIKWSHRMGLVALAMSLMARAIDAINPRLSLIPTTTDHIGYLAFMHAAFLFFMTTIATTCYVWFNAHSSQAALPVPELKNDDAHPEEVRHNLVSVNSPRKSPR
jgi:hypothetical protein